MSILLSWCKYNGIYDNKKDKQQNGKLKQKPIRVIQSVSTAFQLLDQFYICLSYNIHTSNSNNANKKIGESLRSALISHVYLDVFEICLKHIITTNDNNPDYETFIEKFYSNFLAEILEIKIQEEEDDNENNNNNNNNGNNYMSLPYHLKLNIQIHGMILILKYINVFIDYNNIHDNDIMGNANKEKRGQLEQAIIRILNIIVTITNKIGNNDDYTTTTTKNNNNNNNHQRMKYFSNDHLISNMYIFIPTLLKFMKKALLKSREKQTIGTPLGSPIHHNMMGNVNMIENINDSIHKVIYQLEESNRVTNNTHNTDDIDDLMLNEGTLPTHTLSQMLKNLINNTSTILLGATGSTSESTNDIIGILINEDDVTTTGNR